VALRVIKASMGSRKTLSLLTRSLAEKNQSQIKGRTQFLPNSRGLNLVLVIVGHAGMG
jgi:hypothetical protein